MQDQVQLAFRAFTFRKALETKDQETYASVLAEDVRLFTPIDVKPILGRETVVRVLGTVFELFQEFKYMEQLDGERLNVLWFNARIGDIPAEGVDLIRFNTAGQIVEFHVMMRPLKALEALDREIRARHGNHG